MTALPPRDAGVSFAGMKSPCGVAAVRARVLGRMACVGWLLVCAPGCGSDSSSSSALAGSAGTSPSAGEAGNAGDLSADGGASGAGQAGDASAGQAPVGDASVLERNNHASRDGHFVQPTLTADAIATFAMDQDFVANFEGNMFASPLYLAQGPGGKGVFFAGTTGNDVLALDETTGSILWKTNLGDSPTANGADAPCGNVHPLGILSTPVIDAASRTIYVANALGTTSIDKHQVHALSVDDGKERAGFPIDVNGMTSGAQTFAPQAENQRSALSLVGGTLYVPYGGHAGDCGLYHGWVIGIDTATPTNRGAWATLGLGEGIWAAGGLASDGTSVFAVTGNNTARVSDRTQSDSEEVLRLSGLAAFTRADDNLFYPDSWQQMDHADSDFGSSNPIYMTLPGSPPQHYIAAVAKDGHLYLLDPTKLGGKGGQVDDFQLAVGGGSVHTSPAAYTTAKGAHYVLSTDGASLCPKGGASGSVVLSVLIAGSPPVPSIEWCAPISGAMTGPVATTTDGEANATVWYVSGGKLIAVDGDTGKTSYTSAETCDGVRQWTSAIAVKGRIVVGGDTHLCSWSAH